MPTTRRRLPKHWCSARDEVLASLSDVVRNQRKIIELSNNPDVLKLAAQTQRHAYESIERLKELKFDHPTAPCDE